ncbi:uncharacterized protein LY89DRAFT_16625 [Mollisia scopiformis]|uniref:Uncharacterized protein n=1 Tax=Mollisia scopiformis TaxID=149040 RepID=A0A194XVU1_MOLSC|nr:uncharacterized protein LY89DRAFT_16625 [Mollisia scopiformis]KUJ24256.1 hypothetical protein LY89DRAFT_16625 [Mollisia scopiformis]
MRLRGRGKSSSHVSNSSMFSRCHLLSKAAGRGNPSARPLWTRVYTMIGGLAVTLFFIGLMIFLEKTLPDGSKSQFHPTWRRDVSLEPRNPQTDITETLVVETSSSTGLAFTSSSITSSLNAPVITLPPSSSIAAASSSSVDPCISSTVSCIDTDCFTLFSTQASCLPPSSSPPVIPTSSSDPCVTTKVYCVETDCYQVISTQASCLPTTSSLPSVPSITPTSIVNPCVTSSVSCIETDCFTLFSTQASCLPAISGPPSKLFTFVQLFVSRTDHHIYTECRPLCY